MLSDITGLCTSEKELHILRCKLFHSNIIIVDSRCDESSLLLLE